MTDVPRGVLFTAGYGDADPADFLAALVPHAIDVALDIRLIPHGWHATYRGRAFLAALETQGGVGRARHTARLGNVAKRDGGEMRLGDETAVDDLVGVLARGLSVVIICGCREVERCHRRFVASLALARDPGITVVDLPPVPRRPRAPKGAPTDPPVGAGDVAAGPATTEPSA